jgi:hypothetical protein
MELKSASKHLSGFIFSRIGLTFAAACLAVIVDTGCETTVPETDTEPPEIRLAITGPVVGRQEMTNPPTESWTAPDGTQLFDLAHDTEYQFLLTVTDEGGVARANLRMPEDFTMVSVEPSETSDEIRALQRSLTLTGTREEARTGLVISGRFRTPDVVSEVLSFEFQTEGADFGGDSGRPNRRFMNVTAAVQTAE